MRDQDPNCLACLLCPAATCRRQRPTDDDEHDENACPVCFTSSKRVAIEDMSE